MKQRSLEIRGLEYHIQEWGDERNPMLFLLHGWMDCGATFKYMSQYLVDSYYLVAPDWRGFGRTQHAHGYWFPDYFADLEKILDHYTPDRAADLVGHSMGGNIALLYAGIHPQRIARVLSLEALGMAPTSSDEAPAKYRRWMREILSDEPSKVYPDLATLKFSIRKGNPRLADDIVDELAELWGKPYGDSGAYQLTHDHKHRYANPVRYNFDDTLAVWREVTAKVGIVMGEQSNFYQTFTQLGRMDAAKEALRVNNDHDYLVSDAAHMLHLEQPEFTAQCVRSFFN